MLLNPNCSITENGRATWYDVYLLSWFHYFLTSEYPVYKMHGMSYQYTVCLKKNGPLQVISHNFINSQHLLIIFGLDRRYSILN